MLLEEIERHDRQRLLVRGLQYHRRRAAGFGRLQPPGGAQAPPIPDNQPREVVLGPWCHQIIARCHRELEKCLRHHRTDRMHTDVGRHRPAAAVPKEARQRLARAGHEWTAQHVAFLDTAGLISGAVEGDHGGLTAWGSEVSRYHACDHTPPQIRVMLSLHSASSARWLDQVDAGLDDILIDHAHCEKKAAGVAMNLLFSYVDHVDLARAMTEIVNEELEHFRLVLDLLERRGIPFRKLTPSSYGQRLHELIRKNEPGRAVDRLLVGGLIEARSCERFAVLAEHVDDIELRDFYRSLFESEARHHSTYVRLACGFMPEAAVRSRLHDLASREAEIIDTGDPYPRMHS